MTPNGKHALRAFLLVVGAGLALLGAGFIGSAVGAQHAVAAPQPTTGAITVAKVPTLPGFTLTWGGTGTLTVPAQVAPGSYLVAADDNLGCVWERLKKNDGRVSSRLDQGKIPRGAAPMVVEVLNTDRYLRLLGCAFKRVSA